ncbi:MAG: hypothetical protein HOE93_00355 [Nitrosopumilus sp.]|jgi:hypothetical protein|nr:hypothetical protein [Nitrosopumilus sp.]MBT3573276.1 hypothetical protein [Nitrosopumilus sp.]MBT3861857.1 hypothetical protein [Nitrosopumilus sp.]MBT3955753.1 hypothetical protein [Nitrosopumilus sp.]MBT6083493.1 hypothetical protein [Nitrosopumilus sp.]
MDSCDSRARAYKNGKTFDECKKIAESLNPDFKRQIVKNGKVLWTEILEQVEYDELIYKLTLKFLRRDGYDIGNHKLPEVKAFNH